MRAETTTESIGVIVQLAKVDVPVRFAHLMPSDDSLKRTLRRFRQKAGVRDLEISKRTISGETFLRYEAEDMAVFAANCDLQVLRDSPHWFADGTFKVSPRDYTQQYTIHAFYDGVTYPCVYALLTGKSELHYTRLLDILEPLFPSPPAPETILTDFEKAAMNAFSNRFPEAAINGCFFHLGQSVWRKIQTLGLQERYKADDIFAQRVRRVLGLAFVPADQVLDYMDLIVAAEVLEPGQELVDFLKYFRATYVGQHHMTRAQRDTFVPAQFVPTTWNLYHRVKNDLPRTNNSLEGFHSAFAKNLPAHPELYKLAERYKNYQHTRAHEREQHLSGRKPPAARKQYLKATARFKNLVGKFDDGVLRGLAYLDKVAKAAKISNV